MRKIVTRSLLLLLAGCSTVRTQSASPAYASLIEVVADEMAEPTTPLESDGRVEPAVVQKLAIERMQQAALACGTRLVIGEEPEFFEKSVFVVEATKTEAFECVKRTYAFVSRNLK